MGTFSLFHWIIVLLIVMVMFGAGRLPQVMGDLAKGVNAFRAGLKQGEDHSAGSHPQPPAPSDDGTSPNRA